MSALDRKLFRDLWHLSGQAVAICLVLACGVATFVMSFCAVSSLRLTQEVFFERSQFAHVFVPLKRAPIALAGRMVEAPGVARVETGIVAEVTLDVPGMREPAVGQLNSVPDRPEGRLNQLYLRRGRYVEPERPGETLVLEGFADAHGLVPGDTLAAVINGKKQQLTVVGVVLSPEFVYPVRPGEFIPDNKHYGLLWMNYRQLEAAFDMKGAFNYASLTLLPGASEAEVLQRLDQLTAPYGGTGAYGRKDQPSYRFIANEMNQLETMASLPPAIFLTVTAFLMHIVFSRLVGLQREQIATLKAFGYSPREIGLHYFKLVMILVLAGVVLGTALGAWLGQEMTDLYARFFRFPEYYFALESWVVLAALGTSIAAALVGTTVSVRAAGRLAVIEAMRPEPPATFRRTWIERLLLRGRLAPELRIIVRNLERQPVKTLFACLGIALAMAILVMGNCAWDAVDEMMDLSFQTAQRQDLTVTFVEPASARATHDLRHLPGVFHVEPFRSVPARLRFEHHSRRLGVLGLVADRRLFRVIDGAGQEIPLPAEGLLASRTLAEIFGCRVGDWIELDVLEGKRPTRRVQLTAVVDDYTEPAAYLSKAALHRLLREAECHSGAFLQIDPAQSDRLYAELKQMPRVAAVNNKRTMIDTFRQLMDENLFRMVFFNVLFASVIAFGVVYNNARIAVAERSRQLATLRVMGFTRGEISRMLLGELGLITFAAIPIGLILGYGLAWLMMAALNTETQRFPLVIQPRTYAFSVVVTLAASLLSALVARRRLDRLDLVAVLKAPE
jgi:putative ABC transport system permease protein